MHATGAARRAFQPSAHRESTHRKIRLIKRSGDALRNERRSVARYPIQLDLAYTVLFKGKIVDSGTGRTIDWSSAGLRFVCERPILEGRKMQLEVRWPLKLDNGVPLKLVVSAQALRTKECETAVRIVSYEFRTRGVTDEAAAQTAHAAR